MAAGNEVSSMPSWATSPLRPGSSARGVTTATTAAMAVDQAVPYVRGHVTVSTSGGPVDPNLPHFCGWASRLVWTLTSSRPGRRLALKVDTGSTDRTCMEWARFAVQLRSRQVILGLIAVGIVIGWRGSEEPGGPEGVLAVLSFASGVALLGVVAGWRRFWTGGAVLDLRLQKDPDFAMATLSPGGVQPTGQGDEVLDLAASGDPYWAPHVRWVHAEGVRDEEIRAYWNQTQATRAMLDRHNDAAATTFYRTELTSGQPAEVARQATIRAVALYGRLEDYRQDEADGVPEDDRRLPSELMPRVTRWARRQVLHPRRLREENQHASSMNARIRREIWAGRL